MPHRYMHFAAAALAVALAALTGCPKPASDTTAADPAAAGTATAPTDAAAPASEPAADTGSETSEAKPIEWFSYGEGMKIAADEGWPVMIDLYADWCGPCKMLDEETWPNPEVQKLADKFVCIKVNVDGDEETAREYGVSSIPLIVFLKSDGTKIDSLTGFRDAEQMAEAMEAALAKK